MKCCALGARTIVCEVDEESKQSARTQYNINGTNTLAHTEEKTKQKLLSITRY